MTAFSTTVFWNHMRLNHLYGLTLVLILSFIPPSARAADGDTVKTEYRQYTPAGHAIPTKHWDTFRNDKLILTREESSIDGGDNINLFETRIFHAGKEVVDFRRLGRGRFSTFHPVPGITVTQIDSDGDGRCDQMSLSDSKGYLVESFAVGADGQVIPISDADLKEATEARKKFVDDNAEAEKRMNKSSPDKAAPK